MYMQDEETENQNVSTHDHDGSRNFVNPVYETMFQVLFGKSIKRPHSKKYKNYHILLPKYILKWDPDRVKYFPITTI